MTAPRTRHAVVLLTAALVTALSAATGSARSHETVQPLPAPNGHGPVALVVGGRFGPANTLALDAKGRTLAYGMGSETVSAFSVCPGGQRVAGIGFSNGSFDLVIRETRSLRVLRRQPLTLPSRRVPGALLCGDRTGSKLVISALWREGDAPFGSALYRLEGNRLHTVWNGTSNHVSLTPTLAYAIVGMAQDRLVSIDLRTGRVVRLASVPSDSDLVPDPTGMLLAGVAGRLAERSRIVLVDLRGESAVVRTAPLATLEVDGSVYWLPGGRFLFLPWYGRDTARVFDLSLRTRSRFRWLAGSATRSGSSVFGVHFNGNLVVAYLPSGSVRLVRRLPGRPETIVSIAR